jgi:hypothetical protein
MFEDTGNRGGNNNDKKGGRSDIMNFAVIKVSRTGFDYSMPMTSINLGTSPMLLGLDGTHLSMTEAVFGKGDELLPGFTLLQGSHTGGLQQEADIRTIAYDPATRTLKNLGQHAAGASYDRHLYSNYLGNNPGMQGRNFAGAAIVKNPFAGMNGNEVTYFTAYGLTGKDPQQPSSAYKPSVYLSLFPMAFTEGAPDPGAGYNDNLPGDDTPDNPAPEEPDPETPGPDRSDQAVVASGCSLAASDGPGGSLIILLCLGVGAASGRRRRRAS